MIRVSVFYPNTEGAKFDHDYYANKHLPFVEAKLSPLGMVSTEVNVGLAGGAPGAPAPYIAAGHLLFNSVEDFQKAFGAHANELMSDIPNYTDIEPVIQVSEIVGS